MVTCTGVIKKPSAKDKFIEKQLAIKPETPVYDLHKILYSKNSSVFFFFWLEKQAPSNNEKYLYLLHWLSGY